MNRLIVGFGLALLFSAGCGGSSSGGSHGAGGSSGAGAGGGGAAGFPGVGGTAGSGGASGGSSGGGGSAASGGSSGSGASGGSSGSGGSAASGGSSGSGGSAGNGGSSGSGGSGGCPTSGAPSGPARHKFDVAALNCVAGGVCTGNEDKCLCQTDFDHLNVAPSHLIGVGTDVHKAQIWAAGNFQAVYVNNITTGWTQGAAAQAAAFIATAKKNFPCGVPKWFIMNELSASQWPNNASYRKYAINLATTMKNTYNKVVVIAAPFATPGAHAADWTALAKQAFVGAEVYLTGAAINKSGNSVAWCQKQYQASITAYANLGVPKSRLFLFEHFGNTTAGTNWGRSGVSAAGWNNAIKARAQAAHNLGFAGFVSYGWGGNLMHAPEADRLGFMDTYTALTLP